MKYLCLAYYDETTFDSLTQEDLVAIGRACQPYDQELAARTRFGGIVVQGGVTSGLLNAVVAEQLPGPGSVFLSTSFQFRAPVRPGDEITARVAVVSAREDKPVTSLEVSITNQDHLVVLDGTAVVWRDPEVSRAVDEREVEGKAEGRSTA